MNLLSILFLERDPIQGGLGIDPKVISYVAVASIIPSVFIILVSPFYVPRLISY